MSKTEYLEVVNLTEDEGVVKKIIKYGENMMAERGQKVYCHYEGRFADGKVFDDSKGKKPLEIEAMTG